MPPKLLIVDDEPDLEFMVQQKFRKEIRSGKLQFVFARDGVEALEKLKGDAEIDLVVTDIRMPKMDGLALLSNLPKVRPELGAVVISAYGDMDNIRSAMSRGALDFLTKPITLEDFGITLNMWLEQAHQRTENLRLVKEKERLEEQLRIARHIQQNLSPLALPEIKGFELGAWNCPCEEIGGDHYDVLSLPGGRVGLAVGDVSGHGVGAAIFAATARAYLRAVAVQYRQAGPALTQLNRVMEPDLERGQFMTLIFGVLDPDEMSFCFASAGHDPPLLYRAQSDSFEEVQTGGLPIGVFPDTQYEEAALLSCQPGDILVVCTDGVWEAGQPPKSVFGKSRLCDVTQQHHGSSAQMIAAAIADAVQSFCGPTPQEDDLTVLVAKCLGPSRMEGGQRDATRRSGS